MGRWWIIWPTLKHTCGVKVDSIDLKVVLLVSKLGATGQVCMICKRKKTLMLWNLLSISRCSFISLRVFAVFLAHFYSFHVCFVSDWFVCILQREDLAGFGRLILTLACGSAASASLEFMASHYSPDLVRITQALLASSPEKSEGHGISTIRQLYPSLAERMFGEVCAAKWNYKIWSVSWGFRVWYAPWARALCVE